MSAATYVFTPDKWLVSALCDEDLDGSGTTFPHIYSPLIHPNCAPTIAAPTWIPTSRVSPQGR
jgi:hypothetical protein